MWRKWSAPARARRPADAGRTAAAPGREVDRRGGRGGARCEAQAVTESLPRSMEPACARRPNAGRTSCRWPLAAGRWPLAAGRWPLAAGRWPVHVAVATVVKCRCTGDGPGRRQSGANTPPAVRSGPLAFASHDDPLECPAIACPLFKTRRRRRSPGSGESLADAMPPPLADRACENRVRKRTVSCEFRAVLQEISRVGPFARLGRMVANRFGGRSLPRSSGRTRRPRARPLRHARRRRSVARNDTTQRTLHDPPTAWSSHGGDRPG